MPEPLIIYSCVTQLAFSIGRRYYNDVHYAWCAPNLTDPLGYRNPPSSDPIKLYWQLKADIAGGDLHSAVITQNRSGIKIGAAAKNAAGIISKEERDLISVIADLASISDFKPLLLAIPFERVRSICKVVAIKERARPTSEEYIVAELPRANFDVLQIDGSS